MDLAMRILLSDGQLVASISYIILRDQKGRSFLWNVHHSSGLELTKADCTSNNDSTRHNLLKIHFKCE